MNGANLLEPLPWVLLHLVSGEKRADRAKRTWLPKNYIQTCRRYPDPPGVYQFYDKEDKLL